MRRIVVVALALVAVLTPSTALARSHARLSVSSSPRSIGGKGFKRHERVRVVLKVGADAAVTLHTTASQSGAFTLQITGYPCGRYEVSATGNQGSRANLAGIKLPRCVV